MRGHFGWALASVVSAGVIGLGGALAADLPLKAPPLAPVAVYNWTSCYVGANGGWKGGRFHDAAATPGGTATVAPFAPVAFGPDLIDLGHLNVDSGAVGGQIGCRWQTASNWVFGVEGDFDWTDLHGTITERTGGLGGSVFIPGDFYDNRARWESSVRGIVGRAFDKWLVYVTGGLAITDVKMTGNYIATTVGTIAFPASAGSDSQTLYGFTVGAGAAYAFAANWDVGAEYRYSQYGAADFNLGTVAAVCFPRGLGCGTTPVTGRKDLSTNEVLLRLNYHFGPAAVVAKY